MGSNNAIGTGALILSANADKLVSGLDKAEQLATKKTAAINAKVGAIGGKGGIGDLAGGLGGSAGVTIASMALRAGPAAAAIAAVGFAAKEGAERLVDLVLKTTEFNKALEESARLDGEASKALDRRLSLADERLDAVAGGADKLAAVSSEIALAEKEMAGYKATAAG